MEYDWVTWINVTLNYDSSYESLELSGLHSSKVFGFPRPVFVMIAGSVILTLLVGFLCIYNFVAIPSNRRKLRRWRGLRRSKDSFDDYEYAKFANRHLIEEYDEDDSEDELYNASEFSNVKKHLIT